MNLSRLLFLFFLFLVFSVRCNWHENVKKETFKQIQYISYMCRWHYSVHFCLYEGEKITQTKTGARECFIEVLKAFKPTKSTAMAIVT